MRRQRVSNAVRPLEVFRFTRGGALREQRFDRFRRQRAFIGRRRPLEPRLRLDREKAHQRARRLQSRGGAPFRFALHLHGDVAEFVKARDRFGRVHVVFEREEDAENLSGQGLRVAVKGGGCSGLMYDLNFDDEIKPADQVFEDKGIKILVDKKSLLYLVGTVLDFSDGLNGKGFQFINSFPDRIITADPDITVGHDASRRFRGVPHQVEDTLGFLLFHGG